MSMLKRAGKFTLTQCYSHYTQSNLEGEGEWCTLSWNFEFHSWYEYEFLLNILFDIRCWIITLFFEFGYLCDMSKNLRLTSFINFFCRNELLVKVSSRYHIKIPRYGMVLIIHCKSWFPYVKLFACD